jgi:hypothetical protein
VNVSQNGINIGFFINLISSYGNKILHCTLFSCVLQVTGMKPHVIVCMCCYWGSYCGCSMGHLANIVCFNDGENFHNILYLLTIVILKYVFISIYFIDRSHASILTKMLNKMNYCLIDWLIDWLNEWMNESLNESYCVQILGICTVMVVRYSPPHDFTVLSC